MTEKGLWDDAVVISTYTDGQAVDDGVLVAVTTKDRVTRAAWEWLREEMGPRTQPPNNWPIMLMTWIAGGSMVDPKARADVRAKAAALGIIDTERARATRVWEENLDGGVFKFEHSGRTFWLIPNEVGGVTMMFPEDY